MKIEDGWETKNIYPIRGKVINDIKSFNKALNRINKIMSSRRCPETGSFIGYKMVVRDKNCSKHVPNMAWNMVLLKLEIPEDAKRLTAESIGGIKCRCDKAKVLQAYDMCRYFKTHDLRKCRIRDQKIFYSYYYRGFEYKVGEMVSVDRFDENEQHSCSSGIHFLMNMEDAIRYFSITT